MNKVDFKKKCRAIKLVIVDVDGVLTDGGMYYSEDGNEMKKFNVRDGVAVTMIQLAGIHIGIFTGEASKLIRRRAKKIGMEFVFTQTIDKLGCLNEYLLKVGYDNQEVAFVGDEINDYCLIGNVGLFFAVADANTIVKDRADYLLKTLGGCGVLREIAQILLSAKGCLQEVVDSYIEEQSC